MSKILITCAVTGSIHTPSMSPYLPFKPDEIARQAVDAAKAGASILHLHARDPETGQPSAGVADFMAYLPSIRDATDAVFNISTGGSAVMTLDQRLAAPRQIAPEMCSLNMGTMNFALYPAAKRISEWKYNWEKPFLEGSDDLVFKNTPRDIARILTELGAERGARFEFECYDVGHLYMLRHFADRGLIEPPFFIQFVFGVLGGMGADPENLSHMKRMADKLFGDDYVFSVLAAGRHQMPFAAMAAAMGGHVRVGLEDSLMIERGQLASSNAEQVIKIRRIVEDLGRSVATPDEARQMLVLKGADRVMMQC
ncbi:3-keto-5-aminohexanoate cleavage protein [Heliomarina baculiformis]|uniref:3-keto-5-aminohexanoate cleavage protein n=1 Tax=Heliomarina baculiformis TaxID=2872036 RepID=UPI001EE36E76|nr:3-keto-5-aminohexanoate cleavage protein [Heliomarina baculiformis]